MSEIPLGVSLEQRDNDFALRRKEADGTVTEIRLSTSELIGLKSQLEHWTSQLLQSLQDKSGQVRPLLVHPVAVAAVVPDALREKVLLTVQAPTGERMVLELSRPLAKKVAEDIPALLAEMGPALGRH